VVASTDNIITYKNKSPKIDKGAYINPFAMVIGEVEIHAGVSLWPGVIVRADEESIVIEENAALLDRTLVEAPSAHPVIVGENVLKNSK
jgi:carbonic anhydrase/acetyltransferase-like protein (isoleucine patch superfamily)